MRVAIIEDELKQQERIQRVLAEVFPEIEILAVLDSVTKACDFLRTNEVDLAIMDVMIKGGTSFDVISKLGATPFHILFITSFEEYAIQAFRQSAVDYLLKPMDVNEFIAAIKKVQNLDANERLLSQYELLKNNYQSPLTNRKIALPSAKGYVFVNPSAIMYCESEGSYTTVAIEGAKPVVVNKTLKSFEQMLHGMGFYRVHNRAVINIEYIEEYDKSDGGLIIMKDGKEIEISRRRREHFINALKGF